MFLKLKVGRAGRRHLGACDSHINENGQRGDGIKRWLVMYFG